MEGHRGKKNCLKAQKLKGKQTMLSSQTTLMKSFFKKPQHIHPTVALPITLDSTSPPADFGLATLLSKLTSVAAQLPQSIPIAKPKDAVAALCGDPKAIVWSLEDDKPYEWLDHKLNNICGSWAVNQGLVPLAIKCSDLGFLGLCHTLQFFVDRKFAPEALLETQMRILLDEVEKM